MDCGVFFLQYNSHRNRFVSEHRSQTFPPSCVWLAFGYSFRPHVRIFSATVAPCCICFLLATVFQVVQASDLCSECRNLFLSVQDFAASSTKLCGVASFRRLGDTEQVVGQVWYIQDFLQPTLSRLSIWD